MLLDFKQEETLKNENFKIIYVNQSPSPRTNNYKKFLIQSLKISSLAKIQFLLKAYAYESICIER